MSRYSLGIITHNFRSKLRLYQLTNISCSFQKNGNKTEPIIDSDKVIVIDEGDKKDNASTDNKGKGDEKSDQVLVNFDVGSKKNASKTGD